MKPRDHQDWHRGRVPLAPFTTGLFEKDMPKIEDFPTERKYREAYDAWVANHYKVRDTGRFHTMEGTGKLRQELNGDYEAEVISLAPTREDIGRELAAQRDARVLSGRGSVSDQLAYYRRYGHTPDGRRLEDPTDRINRAYAAIYASIDAGEDNR
jgi:hypothetical protein